MKVRNLVFSTVVLGLFATGAVADEHADEEKAEKVCISSNLVRNFDGLDDEHVFVEQSSRDYYLLTMRTRCTGLRYARAIALKDTTRRICSGGFGELIYRDNSLGVMKCRIDTIERVENKDEARAIIDERKNYEKEMKAQRKAEKKKKKEMKKAEKEAAEE